MNVLFYGRHDWANVCNRVARGLRSVGHAARVCTVEAHPFGYREDMTVAGGTHGDLREFARAADWFVSTGDGEYSWFEAMRLALPLPASVRLATMHVGSAYRQDPDGYNAEDKRLGFARRFIGADLFRFAKDDPLAVPYFAPADGVATSPAPAGGGPLVAHSPTSRATKGTDAIVETIRRALPWPGILDLIEGVPYPEADRRRAACRIFVDQLNPEIGGFGASSVEAMAAGCAVIADYRNVIPEVWRHFRKPPIVQVSTSEELAVALGMSNGKIDDLQHASLAWARENTAPEPLGRWWAERLS